MARGMHERDLLRPAFAYRWATVTDLVRTFYTPLHTFSCVRPDISRLDKHIVAQPSTQTSHGLAGCKESPG